MVVPPVNRRLVSLFRASQEPRVNGKYETCQSALQNVTGAVLLVGARRDA
jgi:hypothetical protein